MDKDNLQIEKIDTTLFENLWSEINKVIVGRRNELKLILTALLSEGHVLLEDLPGTGKTTMVKAFAKAVDCLFARVQCTPDLLPSDILGVSIFNPKTNDFYFCKGPVFTNILLVDEINRTLPRTQSSLLECMEERQVSIDGKTYLLAKPFLVIATQNPIEMEGTFPLPEAQLDRFSLKIKLGYPTQEEEKRMLELVGDTILYEKINSKLNPEIIQSLQEKCQKVYVHSSIREYIAILAQETRSHPLVAYGVSPRASKAIYKMVKAWALINGRDYVIPDDVKIMLKPVWNHRLILKTEAHINNTQPEDILEEILGKVSIPDEKVIRDEQ
ncbi:MAG TPA: MoxR family ATPase [Peptococcaceae bacterium]|nr:MoxR family ATPase [Peptococcaceae bacterium]